MGVAACMAAIPDAHCLRHQALYECTNSKAIAFQPGRDNVMDDIIDRQERVVRSRVGNIPASIPASIPSSIELIGMSTHTTPSTNCVERINSVLTNQPSIDAAVQNTYSQGGICKVNNSKVEMAIADL